MNRSDQDRNAYMLCGPLARRGYLRWWHSFSGVSTQTGEKRSFFVEYMILNPIVAKQKKNDGSRHPSYVRVSAGFFPTAESKGLQLHSYHPISSAKYAKKPLYFQVDQNILRENRIVGSIQVDDIEAKRTLLASDEGSMSWDLEIYKTIACHTGILSSRFFCALNALDTYFHGEGIKTHYRGMITVNGEDFEVLSDACDGYADKHWGRDYNQPWLQLASSNLISERTGKLLKHSALVIDGCCPRFLFFRLKQRMILQLTYTGEDYCFSFAKPLSKPRLKWGTKENKTSFTWHVKAANKDSLIKLSVQSSKDSMMNLRYDRPVMNDKEKAPRLKAGTEGSGTLDLYRLTPAGKEWIDTLTIQNCLCEYEKPVRTGGHT
ncbi:MAG: hypothetical protein J6Z22_01300 [Lachnospiraceae bacterium]|nr:hypothetical protein [Lachnospiraceae bacterium]